MSKRLMPTYLVNFLKEIYDGTIPSNFGKRMVSRQFIARVKELYETLGGANPSDYSRRMVNEYLIKFFNEIEIVEYTDDDVKMTKDIPSDLVYPACRIDSIGGMSYKVEGTIQHSPVTAVKTYNTDNELLDTYTVPSAITSLEGYGKGINSTVYNNVDFASGKYVKKVGVVDLGTLDWNYGTASATPGFNTPKPSDAKSNSLNGLCSIYTVEANWWTTPNNYFKIYIGASNINVGNSNYTDPVAFKEAMNGVLLYYELATPVETSITENAPLLEVEEGGTVVFENEYNNDVPSEVTTWIKES